MRLSSTLYLMALFFVLTPGILLTLPSKGSVYLVAFVHAIVFGLVYKLTHKAVYRYFSEGFINERGQLCITDADCHAPRICREDPETKIPSCVKPQKPLK